jgi:hypothetical protein
MVVGHDTRRLDERADSDAHELDCSAEQHGRDDGPGHGNANRSQRDASLGRQPARHGRLRLDGPDLHLGRQQHR